MKTNGGEAFARLDTSNNLVLKGFVGGASGGGHMNDEDSGIPAGFVGPVFVPYSNTLSDVDNEITYGTIDLGYDWLRARGYKVASFVGYNAFRQKMKAFGCAQVANPNSDCVPATPTSVLGITEDDTWQAFRVGMAAEFMPAPRLKFSADAAYLPYVWFDGTDNHVLRALVSPKSGHGNGVQLEAMVSYALTDRFSVGVGGRYWAMRTTSADTNFGGTGTFVPQRFATEQAALLVQGSVQIQLGLTEPARAAQVEGCPDLGVVQPPAANSKHWFAGAHLPPLGTYTSAAMIKAAALRHLGGISERTRFIRVASDGSRGGDRRRPKIRLGRWTVRLPRPSFSLLEHRGLLLAAPIHQIFGRYA